MPIFETAICIAFFGKAKVRAHGNEINVQTLISSTIFAQSIAVKIFKVYSPALLVRRIGCEVMLSDWRTLTEPSDVVSDFDRKIVDTMRIPRAVVI